MQGAPCVVSVVQVMVFVGIEIKGTKQSQSLTAAQCDFSSFSNRMKERQSGDKPVVLVQVLVLPVGMS